MDSSNSGFEDNEQRMSSYIEELKQEISKLQGDKLKHIVVSEIDEVVSYLFTLKTSIKNLHSYVAPCVTNMPCKVQRDELQGAVDLLMNQIDEIVRDLLALKTSSLHDLESYEAPCLPNNPYKKRKSGSEEPGKNSAKKRAKKE